MSIAPGERPKRRRSALRPAAAAESVAPEFDRDPFGAMARGSATGHPLAAVVNWPWRPPTLVFGAITCSVAADLSDAALMLRPQTCLLHSRGSAQCTEQGQLPGQLDNQTTWWFFIRALRL